jgi:hypothetical protein
VESLQQAAGNAAVGHLIRRAGEAATSGPRPAAAPPGSTAPPLTVSRWASLGAMEWDTTFGHVHRQVNVGTEAEWRARLKNMDDEDEVDFARGFLETINDPSMVGRTRHPNGWGGFRNTISRVPSDAEVMAFMRALYSLGDDLDLPNTMGESGPFVRWFQKEFGDLIRRYQGRVIQEVSARGEAISATNIRAVAKQGGSRQVREAMIVNAGATAMKGIDLVKTANLLPRQSQADTLAREVARRNAFETIRNSGRTIRAVLEEHDAEVAFQQAVIGMVFESVWEMIPAGGALATGAKEFLKLGLSKMLQGAAANDEPRDQAEAINTEFVQTVNGLVPGGHIDASDANGAINGFEAVRR